MKWHLIVFTDLDGTLLDHTTYSFKPALPALKALGAKNIPVIFCTSKTRAEIEAHRLELNNIHPFISENGGALFIPKEYFSHSFSFTRHDSHYYIIEWGTPYPKLREVFNQMRTSLPGKLRGFGDLSAQEVAELCGLSLAQATLAKQREYDEPFLLDDEVFEEHLKALATRSHLHINRGGRFYHLIGNCDKGKAVLSLRDIYTQESPHIKTVALGDSLNDLPMLEAVDYPILIQKPDGSYDPSVKLNNLIFSPDSGPLGWCKVMLEFLNTL